MKYLTHILLKVLLLFVFTATSHTIAWACGKSQPKKQTQQYAARCQKSCCKKQQTRTYANCQSTCCQKKTANTGKPQKGCCGDSDCSCSVTVTVLADLPQSLSLDIYNITPTVVIKNTFFYQQSFPLSSLNDIWQPPISALAA